MFHRVRVGVVVSVVVAALLSGIGCGGPAQPTPPNSRTLTATLVPGYELSGPYSWTLTGPSGFSCTMASSQNVTCPTASYADGTSVTLTVKLIAPTFDDVGIISAEGCDSITKLTCTVLMNANKVVKIRVSSPI